MKKFLTHQMFSRRELLEHPRAWTRGRKETERIAKEQAAERVQSWTVKNEMRGVLGRASADAVGKILDSANPGEIRA